MRTTRFLVAFLLLYCPLLRADEPLPPPIAVATNVLQLSPDQTAALITMIQTRDAAMQPLGATLRTDQEALGKLLESAAPDPAAVGKLLLEIRAAQRQAETVGRDAAASFERLLTPEQRERLQFLRQAAQVEPAIPALRAVGLV